MSDVFDEDADELMENKNEFNKIMENIEKEGLVEGIEEGKQKIVQDAFNKGYEIAFKYFYKINLLKGIISSFSSIQKDEQASQLKIINESLTKLENRMMEELVKNEKQDIDELFNNAINQIKNQLKETNLLKDVESFFQDE